MSEEVHEIANAVFALINNLERYMQRYNKQIFKTSSKSESRVSGKQYYILFIIGYLKINTVSGLSDMAAQSASSMSILISRLCDNGLIYKEYPSKGDDKRKVFFHLTAKGTEQLKRFTDILLNGISRFYQKLDDKQKVLFYEGMQKLARLGSDGVQCEVLWLGTDVDKSKTILKCLISLKSLAAAHLLNEFEMNKKGGDKLTANQYRVLRIIHNKNIDSIQTLAKSTCVNESTMSITLSKLNDEGFLLKSRAGKDDDARKISFEITPKGITKLDEAHQNMLQAFERYYCSLSGLQKRDMSEGVEMLNQVFSTIDLLRN